MAPLPLLHLVGARVLRRLNLADVAHHEHPHGTRFLRTGDERSRVNRERPLRGRHRVVRCAPDGCGETGRSGRPLGPAFGQDAEQVVLGDARHLGTLEGEQGDERAVRESHARPGCIVFDDEHRVAPSIEHGIQTRLLGGERAEETALGRLVAEQDQSRRASIGRMRGADEANLPCGSSGGIQKRDGRLRGRVARPGLEPGQGLLHDKDVGGRDPAPQQEPFDLDLRHVEDLTHRRIGKDDAAPRNQGDPSGEPLQNPARAALRRPQLRFDPNLLADVLDDDEEPGRVFAVPAQGPDEEPRVEPRPVVTDHQRPSLDAALPQALARELRQKVLPRALVEEERRIAADDGVLVPAEHLSRPGRQRAEIAVRVRGDDDVAARGLLQRVKPLARRLGTRPPHGEILGQAVGRFGDRPERRPRIEVEARAHAPRTHLFEEENDLLGVLPPSPRKRDQHRADQGGRENDGGQHEDERRREIGEDRIETRQALRRGDHGDHRSRGAGLAKW